MNSRSQSNPSTRLNSHVLESVLNSRIDQAIAITPPTDQSRIDLLEGIRRIEAYPERVASLSDCLIDYIVTLSKEVNETKLQISRLEEQRPPKRRRRHLSANDDYEECLRLLRTSRDHLSDSLEELIAQNSHLRRVRRQDKAILIKQNEVIAGLRRNYRTEEISEEQTVAGSGGLKSEYKRISEELEILTREVDLRESQRNRRR
jgi:hypothetical protein